MDTMTQKPAAGIGNVAPSKPGSIDHEIETLKSDIAGLAASVANVARSGMADVQSAAVEKTDELARSIKNHPLQATLISVGVGFLVGLLVTR